jgi:anti-anti-sigma factor
VVAPPNFRIETAQAGSGTTIKLAGELDSATCPLLVERFDQLVAAGAGGQVVLDLTEVSFVDSAGMRAIVVIERSAQEHDIPLALRPPAGPVTDLLQISGVGAHLALRPQADDAPSAPFVERIDLELARVPTSPGRARAELREALGGRLGDTDSATLTLLTSELVTNSVIHPGPGAGDPIGLRITTFDDRVRVEVSDSGPGFDTATLPPRPRETGGHGLVVVDGLSSRWGTRRLGRDGGERFCVWFELDVAGGLGGEAIGDDSARDEAAAATTAGAPMVAAER